MKVTISCCTKLKWNVKEGDFSSNHCHAYFGTESVDPCIQIGYSNRTEAFGFIRVMSDLHKARGNISTSLEKTNDTNILCQPTHQAVLFRDLQE